MPSRERRVRFGKDSNYRLVPRTPGGVFILSAALLLGDLGQHRSSHAQVVVGVQDD